MFVQGEAAERCHALIQGRVRITQSDEEGAQLVVRFIGPAEMFGTVALFTDRKYPAEAVTVIDSIEISWTEAALRDLIGRHPKIALNIVTIIGARLREVQEWLREFATQRAECRIARVLLRLAAQAGRGASDEATIDFPLTRKDVAEMCGATQPISTASDSPVSIDWSSSTVPSRRWTSAGTTPPVRAARYPPVPALRPAPRPIGHPV